MLHSPKGGKKKIEYSITIVKIAYKLVVNSY